MMVVDGVINACREICWAGTVVAQKRRVQIRRAQPIGLKTMLRKKYRRAGRMRGSFTSLKLAGFVGIQSSDSRVKRKNRPFPLLTQMKKQRKLNTAAIATLRRASIMGAPIWAWLQACPVLSRRLIESAWRALHNHR